jgi:hypothetical protein
MCSLLISRALRGKPGRRRWRPSLPCDDEALATYRACTGRAKPPGAPFTEAALCVGRRGGKSRILALIAVYLATFRDYRPHLAPGECATIVCMAANRSQARSIFRFVIGMLKAVPLIQPMIVDDNTEQITLSNRVIIEIGTASFRTTRGYSYAAVLADEVAFWRSEESSANPDVEIMRAVRPGLASIPNAVLLLASSPYAKKGELYNAFRRYHGKDDARVLFWKAPTELMNSRVDKRIIEEARESDPESARAEYDAEFRDDLADYITREAIDAVTMWGRHELPPEPSITYSAFIDPSGGVSDSMTLAVAHLSADAVCVLDAVLEVRPPFDPTIAVEECTALLNRFSVTRAISDRYSGEWARARFAEHGIALEQSARPKSDIYHDLLPLLNARRVELLDNHRLAAQLVGLERRTSRQGKDSIDHSPGGHDDLANAVGGVLVGLDLDRRSPLVRQSDMLMNGAALPIPAKAKYIVAVLAVDKFGAAAVIYSATTWSGPPLLIIDFDAGPMGIALFPRIGERVRGLSAQCRAHGSVVFAPAALADHARAVGLVCEAVPKEFEPEELLLSAGAHSGAGKLKLCEAALDKSRTQPFGAALDFRAAEGADDPLRAAALLTIALALDIPQ